MAVDMSMFTASDTPPPDLCVAKIQECSVYVGVVGFRYGSLVRNDDDTRSYVELEYETAKTTGLPLLIFVISDDAHGPRGFHSDPHFGDRQDDFRARLDTDNLTRCSVSTPEELELAVFHALRDLPPTGGDHGRSETVAVAGVDRGALPLIDPPFGLRSTALRGRGSMPADLARFDPGAAEESTGSDPSPVDGHKAIVLHGIGGVGKTRLALEVAYQARDQGRTVWWVAANAPAAFEAGMQAVGFAAGATDDDYRHANAADATWRVLDRLTTPWLLVIDNADDPSALNQYGPMAKDEDGSARPNTAAPS
ncbi:MAG: DUF4062 domain-containing protein [Kineosporiaceae bacterium]|nr:DUF4062 domain-containing protein [Kineosporiaceae bacterium]